MVPSLVFTRNMLPAKIAMSPTSAANASTTRAAATPPPIRSVFCGRALGAIACLLVLCVAAFRAPVAVVLRSACVSFA